MESGIDPRLIGLGIALGVGFIIGLQREWAQDKPVGLRSFILISAMGGMAALLSQTVGGWPVAAGLIALALVLGALTWGKQISGITTMVASLVVYMIGAAAVAGYWLHALVMGGVVTIVLHWKRPMHRWAGALGHTDFEIIARFILITLVILPVLPDRTFGPYDVFNPFQAWLLVVLIVSISLAGYIAFRLLGTGAGGWLAGLLGGLVSSTATTIGYASLSRRQPQLGGVATLVILVASVVMYARLAAELLVVAPALVVPLLVPSCVFSAVLLALAGFVHFRTRGSAPAESPERRNPAQIRLALAFAGLYVLILFAVAAARDYFGEGAISVVAGVSGLTNVDALTLSVGQLYDRGEIGEATAWRAIFLASLSNLAFKTTAAALLGSSSLRRWIVPTGGIALAFGVVLLWLWP